MADTWQIVVGCCCLAIVVLIVIGAISPDNNNSTVNDTVDAVKINASGENMTFFGMDTPIGNEGYQYLTYDEDGNLYYMDYMQGELVAKCDPNTRLVYLWDLKQTSNEGYQYQGSTIGSNGINHILAYQPREHESVQFEYPRGGNFTFTYKNKTVLNNKNARVVDKLYYPNGTEITSDDNTTTKFLYNSAEE